MTLYANIDEASLRNAETGIVKEFEKVRSGIEQAMAEKFFEIVRSNFGVAGVDRPTEWAPLTESYSRRMRRDYATLFVTGRLEQGVKMETLPDGSRVFISDSDVSYSLSQQYGSSKNNLPARPYFPIDAEGNVTPFTLDEVTEASNQELARLLLS